MKKLSKETKIKLIYSGELLVFAILFLVFGILKFTKVMGYNPTRTLIFNIITLAGAAWGITDFTWAICSKKRQQRISLLDKILILPLVVFMITYDIICLASKQADEFYLYMLGSAFLYVAVIYTFEAIYHFHHPIPGLFDEDEEEKNDENSREKPQI
jgi:hypothetical protein